MRVQTPSDASVGCIISIFVSEAIIVVLAICTPNFTPGGGGVFMSVVRDARLKAPLCLLSSVARLCSII